MSPSADPVQHHDGYDLDADHPFTRVWRGTKDGSVKLAPMPKFNDPYAEREWIKAHLAAVFRYWGKQGYEEGNAGHITVRDPVLPGYYWMNPIGVHYSSMTVSKLVLVDPTGHVSPYGAQLPINAAGYFIHSAIHEARPDIHAAAHCHSTYGRAWSVFGKPVDITTQDSCVLYDNLSVYENFGGVVRAYEEGRNIAEALGPKNKTCILQNHGLLSLGTTVDEAAFLFTRLEKQCQTMLLVEAARSANLQPKQIQQKDAEYSAKFIQDPLVSYSSFQPEYDLIVEETNGSFLN
ncbi:hypothetical protein H0H92_013862 [Tricholoma furcatifolium]|nr:hypothetical protein H0H92_013862 [Tricholoma furcatifolium]